MSVSRSGIYALPATQKSQRIANVSSNLQKGAAYLLALLYFAQQASAQNNDTAPAVEPVAPSPVSQPPAWAIALSVIGFVALIGTLLYLDRRLKMNACCQTTCGNDESLEKRKQYKSIP